MGSRSKGTIVFRAGVGLYYENNLFNNILFDRTVRLQKAQVFGSMNLCPSGNLPWPDGSVHTTSDGLDIASQTLRSAHWRNRQRSGRGKRDADLQHTYPSSAVPPQRDPRIIPFLSATT